MKELKDLFDYKDFRNIIWTYWYIANILVVKYSDNNLAKARGLSYEQFFVLSVMNKLDKKANATVIAKLLNRSPNTLTTIFARMEKKGLLVRTRDKLDRRVVWAVMTAKGRDKLADTSNRSLAVFQNLDSCFSIEELERFNTLLEKLIVNADRLVHPPNRRKKPKPTWD